MASTDARPIPIKNTAYRVTFPILDADGDLVTGATGLDSEVSLDGAAFADCTNEATEIATSSGMYYLDLTSGEMNADTVAIIVKTSSSGAKTTPIVLYPNETGDIDVDVTAFGGTAATTSGGRPEVNSTHWAGTAVGSTTVRSDLINIAGAAVSASTAQLGVNVVNWKGTAAATVDTAGYPVVTIKDGTGQGEIATTSGAVDTVSSVTAAAVTSLQNGIISAASFANDALPDVWGSFTASSGTSSTLVGPGGAGLSATNDLYNGFQLDIVGGTGAGQSRPVVDYTGATRTFSVPTWTTTPDATSVAVLRYRAAATLAAEAGGSSDGTVTSIQAAVWTYATRVLTAGTNIQLPSNGLDNVTLPANIITATSIAANSFTDAKFNSDAFAKVYTTSMTEAYGTDGSTLTLAQGVYLLVAHMGEHGISGTTKTLKKLDATTTAATFTLDSATTPTSITRAT